MKEKLISQVPLFEALPRSEIEYLAWTLRAQLWTALWVFSPEGPPADDVTVVVIKVD